MKQLLEVATAKKIFFLALCCLGIFSTLRLWDVHFFHNAKVEDDYLIRGILHLIFSLPLLPLFRFADWLKFGSAFILVYLLFSPL